MKRVSDATRRAVVADYLDGMSTVRLAASYRISTSTAHRIVTDAGVSRTLRDAKAAERDEEYGLNGGRWVPRRGVLHWEPTPKAAPLIACPCGAGLSEPCRTATGKWTHHADRLIPRRCACGNTLPAGVIYCTDECRRTARTATYAKRERRNPTRDRRAA